LATAVSCKNCSHKFSDNDKIETKNESQTLTDTFCGLNLIIVSIAAGIVFCLYWNSYVLSYILPSGRYPIILLILFYLPAGILALVCGFVWFAILRATLRTIGFRVSE
jgi:hypothetical protein